MSYNEKLENLVSQKIEIPGLTDIQEVENIEHLITEDLIVEDETTEPVTPTIVDFNKPLGDMSDDEAAEYAKTLGWSPKEEFRGDKSRWTDAKTFAERAEKLTPVLRENLRRLAEKNANNDRTTEYMAANFAKHQAFMKKTYEKQMQEMQEKINNAYGIEDVETFNKLVQDKQEIEIALNELTPIAPLDRDWETGVFSAQKLFRKKGWSGKE